MNGVYFNTTSLTGEPLAAAKSAASCQNATVLRAFEILRRPLTPSEVWQHGIACGESWLLTSVRRSMTVLAKSGALVKLGTKRRGAYGRPEHEWANS